MTAPKVTMPWYLPLFANFFASNGISKAPGA
jgi:hypothetical protein